MKPNSPFPPPPPSTSDMCDSVFFLFERVKGKRRQVHWLRWASIYPSSASRFLLWRHKAGSVYPLLTRYLPPTWWGHHPLIQPPHKGHTIGATNPPASLPRLPRACALTTGVNSPLSTFHARLLPSSIQFPVSLSSGFIRFHPVPSGSIQFLMMADCVRWWSHSRSADDIHIESNLVLNDGKWRGGRLRLEMKSSQSPGINVKIGASDLTGAWLLSSSTKFLIQNFHFWFHFLVIDIYVWERVALPLAINVINEAIVNLARWGPTSTICDNLCKRCVIGAWPSSLKGLTPEHGAISTGTDGVNR